MPEKHKEDIFWNIIGSYNSIEIIENQLNTLSIEENMIFDKQLRDKLKILIKPKIAEIYLASYNHKPNEFEYISNDGFLDFRAWIIHQGKNVYTLFLNFKSEEELVHLDLHPEVAYSEMLLYVVLNTLDKKTNGKAYEKLDYIPQTGADEVEKHSQLYLDVDFKNLEKKHPIIFSKYSN